MATLGVDALTLADYKKRIAPDGSIDFIIEALVNSNPIMDDIPWKEGNLPTGNLATIRTSRPKPSARLINRGVPHSKSTTEQVTDTCIILEARSQIDIEQLALAANKEAFRRSEDAAFVSGFTDVVAENIFYGDTAADPLTFNGLAARYPSYGGTEKNKPAYQVIAGGTAGTGATNTTAFFVGWGTHATCGIYPKNSIAGLKQRDLAEMTVKDASGLEFQALVTLFTWKCGLHVADIRSNALVTNIDTTTLAGMTSANKLKLIEQFVIAKNRIRNLQSRDKKVVLYVSDKLYDWFEMYLLDKTNVHVTRQELMADVPRLYFSGIEIKKCDAISNEETAREIVS